MRKLLIPKKGIKVRDAQTSAHYPETGLVRNITTYEDRRIKDGDLIVHDVPVQTRESAKPISTSKKTGDK